jgi:hypothetical protein
MGWWWWWWWWWRNSTSWWLLMNRDDGSWVSHANHLISLFGCDTDISLVSGFNLIEGVASLSNAWLFWRLKLSGVDAPRLARCFFFHLLTWTKRKLTPQTLAIFDESMAFQRIPKSQLRDDYSMGTQFFFHRGYAGYERWRTGWSDAKKHWCCDRFGKGCPHKERSVE